MTGQRNELEKGKFVEISLVPTESDETGDAKCTDADLKEGKNPTFYVDVHGVHFALWVLTL